MGKQAVVAQKIDAPGLPVSGFYTVGATVVLTDAEYNALPAYVVASLTSITTVADPVRGTPASPPSVPLQENVNAVAASGAAQTLPDVTSDTIHRAILTANCTLTFPTAVAGKSFTLVLVQDATGSRTVTWPGTVKWPGGTAPILTTAANKTDAFSFLCADGTNWLGFTAGQAF